MNKRRRAFVLMPFQSPFDSYYSTIFKPALEEAGYDVARADDLFVPRPIILDIQELIVNADLLLCEMSGKNANVFYELGLSHAIGKPAILLSSNEQDIPFDLRHIRTIVYDRLQPDWAKNLQKDIKAAARSVLDSNVIWPKPLVEIKTSVHDHCDIKITSPTQGEIRSGRFEVTGTFDRIPTSGFVQLFLASIDNTEYWPQEAVRFDTENKTWSGHVAFYEEPPREANIIVAHVGKSGGLLCSYYTRVGHKTGTYLPLLRLADDIVECDSIKVFKHLP